MDGHAKSVCGLHVIVMSDIRNDVTKQNGGDSVGTLYRRSMDRLMIRDVQRKEIRRNLW